MITEPGHCVFLRQGLLGLGIEKVTALIGDTGLPEAPMQAGASLTSSLGSAALTAAVAPAISARVFRYGVPRGCKVPVVGRSRDRQDMPQGGLVSR